MRAPGALLLLLFIAARVCAGQGFGGVVGITRPRAAKLQRVLPAAVDLRGKRIRIAARPPGKPGGTPGVTGGSAEEIAAIARVKLATAIQKDPRFIMNENNPEAELDFTITGYILQAHTIPPAGSTPGCTFYTGRIDAAYQAVDTATGRIVDAENIADSISGDDARSKGAPLSTLLSRSLGGCGTNAKVAENKARDSLIDALVAKIGQRTALFEETIQVPVPGGRLTSLSALAVSQRWTTLLESAEKTDPLPTPNEDAYREYLIGLACEALAYQNAREAAETTDPARKNFQGALDYMARAANAYKNAIQAKPVEHEFALAYERVAPTAKLYSVLNTAGPGSSQAVAPARNETTGKSSTAEPATPATPAAALDRIVGLCRNHFPDIGRFIKDDSYTVRFTKPLTPMETLRVRAECGDQSPAILDAIRAQVTVRPSSTKTGKQ